MASNIYKLFLSTILILIVFSCKIKEKSDLFGTYLADYGVAKEELILNKDGTFVQKVTIKSTSKVNITNGKWS